MPYGCGLALAYKEKIHLIEYFVINSDGEMAEGSNWEAILFASHHKLDNLVLIIDYNKLQSFDSIEATLKLEPLRDKFMSFGWNIFEVDGHNYQQIENALLKSKNISGKPICIIANTIKGKGISFMENKVEWHYKAPSNKEYNMAIRELISPRLTFIEHLIEEGKTNKKYFYWWYCWYNLVEKFVNFPIDFKRWSC